jgi:NTE family protein
LKYNDSVAKLEGKIVSEPKIGLALGSGGARGFAHVGVLKALIDEGIQIDLIAGSSMGSLIAAFYGAGYDMNTMVKLATSFRRKYYLDFTLPKMGFIAGRKVKDLVKFFTKGKNIEDLSIPVGIVATDLIKGEKKVFKSGNLSDAVRASISIPGIFVPEMIDGRLYIDGGVIDRVPVTVAKDMGADFVIAVDVSPFEAEPQISSIQDVIIQSIDIMQRELVRHMTMDAKVIIRPKTEQFSSRAFQNINDIIACGEREARKCIPQIKEEIQKWKEQNSEDH